MADNPHIPASEIQREESPLNPAPVRINIWNAVQTVLSIAVIMATLLTMWTPSNIFSNKILEEMLLSVHVTPTPEGSLPTPTALPAAKIGLVAGHWGHDSGTVCGPELNNTKEVDINLRIANLVQQKLVKEGYQVDLLEEFDKRLFQYQAMALVSIHNDSCEFVNNEATGYKVAAAPDSPYPEKAKRLTDCLTKRYGDETGMLFHPNTITPDMTSYHAFNEIHSSTTAAIIETGFLNLDYTKLTTQTEAVAAGVASGILCYIRNEALEPAPEVPTSTGEPAADVTPTP